MNDLGASGASSRTLVPCPACASIRFRARHRVAGFAIVDCCECGFTFVNPQPSEADLSKFYAEVFHTPEWYGRFPHLKQFDYFGSAAGESAGHRSYVDLVRRLVFPGSWLDVGCGHGALAQCASEAGYDAFGVEPSALAVEAARRRLGRERVFLGSLDDVRFAANRFSVVSVIGTIEHLPQPLAILREIHRILALGGLLLVQTPNLGSLQYRRLGAAWEQFTPPGHLLFFTPRTLHRMLRTAGFIGVHFDMRFPFDVDWTHGSAAGGTSSSRRPLLAKAIGLLGSRCELALQRLKGRFLGKHDIVCLARTPRHRR